MAGKGPTVRSPRHGQQLCRMDDCRARQHLPNLRRLDWRGGQRYRRDVRNRGWQHGSGQRHSRPDADSAGRAIRRPGLGKPGNYLQQWRDHGRLDGPGGWHRRGRRDYRRPGGAATGQRDAARWHADFGEREHAHRRRVRCRHWRHAVDGYAIGLAGGVTNNSGNTQTIDASLVLGGGDQPLTPPRASW